MANQPTRPIRTTPQALRALAVVAAIVAVSIASADLTGTQVAAKPAAIRHSQPRQGATLQTLEQKVFNSINEVRKQHGLEPLNLVPELLPLARRHSRDQAGRNCLTHRSADGLNAGQRLDAARVPWLRYGENVGLVKGYADPAGTIMDAWMRSSGHAANILDARLHETAVGVARAADGTYFLTQVFVTR